jgi:adenine phosphoribosyltransferase
MEELKSKIRDIPDFPKKGIIFKDITTLLGDARGFNQAISALVERYRDKKIDVVVGIEARGFIVGAPVAYALKTGFVPIRKPGKLPYKSTSASYSLEYGTNTIEIHEDAIKKGQKVLILDDLLATGGTIEAAAGLVKKMGGDVVELGFLIELTFLNGREKLKDFNVHSLMSY